MIEDANEGKLDHEEALKDGGKIRETDVPSKLGLLRLVYVRIGDPNQC